MELNERQTVIQQGLSVSTLAGQRVTRRWRCRVVSGPDAGREAWLDARLLTIGADKGCGLVLSDQAVSRRHAELVVGEHGVVLRDLDSTNGTQWMGTRISEVVLPDEATFRCGETTLELSAAAPPPLPPSDRTRFGGLVGESALMREIYTVLELASPTEATILMQGESGSGKEVAARAIHDHSTRARGPFVVVDCSAVHDELIEAKLFGHKKGAFTGAVADRKGAFVEATGGTLFIDELGELSLPSQAKLLRVLEQREIYPVGQDRPQAVDVRVIAATHRDLKAMVVERNFRFDLFHRLSVVHLRLPPLREHVEDLPALIAHFYEGRGIETGPIEGPNLELLQRHGWPGNVRELRNVLERGWALGGSMLAFSELRLWLDSDPLARAAAPALERVDVDVPFKEAKEAWLQRFELRYLEALYAAHGGNISRAAEHAGLSRRHLRELLVKHRLHGDD